MQITRHTREWRAFIPALAALFVAGWTRSIRTTGSPSRRSTPRLARTPPPWRMALRCGLCVGVVGCLPATPAQAFVDPATVTAAAATAKEVGEKAKEILEFLGYMKTGGGAPSLPDQINELRGSVNRLEGKIEAVLAKLGELEQNEVNKWNWERLQTYKRALIATRHASDKLHYLVTVDPTNVVLRAEAASLTWEALFEFEFRPA
jgi:hypothetical protein